MKRRKQVEELSNGHDNEPTQKRARSGSRTISSPEEDDDRNSLKATTGRRRSFRRGRENGANGHDSTHPTEEHAADDTNEENGTAEEATDEDSEDLDGGDVLTPIKMGSGRASHSTNKGQTNGTTPVKRFQGKNLFSTPVKPNSAGDTNETPRLERHADRSARRKSTRTLIERTILGNTSDNDEEDEDIAHHIYDSEDEDEPGQEIEMNGETSASVPATPSKRGRPKGSKNRQKSPTPTRDLPPHEVYFSQNRGGRSKTSDNNLSSLALLDHEEYFALVRSYENPHSVDLDSLQKLYATFFNQWLFELSQDFNICVYGWGSKRSLLMNFAEHIYKAQTDHINNKIVVINGYVQHLTIRDILNTVAAAVSESGAKLGSQPAEMLEKLISTLEEDKTKNVTVMIHSIDGTALRRPTTQIILSRLSSHPQIHLVASADHPSFPLLWDSSLRSTFNFLFHDCTTFQPYTSEMDVVEEVHELLGRSGRRVGGKEGVSFVLKSLPENAKNLFRVLVGEQLAAMDESIGTGFGGADDDDDYDDNDRHTGNFGKNEPGVEYKVLYQKACEEFICSSEMSFRTLLKE